MQLMQRNLSTPQLHESRTPRIRLTKMNLDVLRALVEKPQRLMYHRTSLYRDGITRSVINYRLDGEFRKSINHHLTRLGRAGILRYSVKEPWVSVRYERAEAALRDGDTESAGCSSKEDTISENRSDSGGSRSPTLHLSDNGEIVLSDSTAGSRDLPASHRSWSSPGYSVVRRKGTASDSYSDVREDPVRREDCFRRARRGESEIPERRLLDLYMEGYTFSEIGRRLAQRVGREEPFTPNAISHRVADLRKRGFIPVSFSGHKLSRIQSSHYEKWKSGWRPEGYYNLSS